MDSWLSLLGLSCSMSTVSRPSPFSKKLAKITLLIRRSAGLPTKAGHRLPSPPKISPVKVMVWPPAKSGRVTWPSVRFEAPLIPLTGEVFPRRNLHLILKSKGLHTAAQQFSQGFWSDRAWWSSRVYYEPLSFLPTDHKVLLDVEEAGGKRKGRGMLLVFDRLLVFCRLLSWCRSDASHFAQLDDLIVVSGRVDGVLLGCVAGVWHCSWGHRRVGVGDAVGDVKASTRLCAQSMKPRSACRWSSSGCRGIPRALAIALETFPLLAFALDVGRSPAISFCLHRISLFLFLSESPCHLSAIIAILSANG